jgi:hypothetical protein
MSLILIKPLEKIRDNLNKKNATNYTHKNNEPPVRAVVDSHTLADINHRKKAG